MILMNFKNENYSKILENRLYRTSVFRARSLLVSDLHSETKRSGFEVCCKLCADVSSLQ